MKLTHGPCTATTSPRCAAARQQAFRPALRSSRGTTAARRAPPAVCSSSPSVEQQARSANEDRWDQQVREGKVRNAQAADLKALMADGWVLLDVRPPSETKKAAIVGAVQVPIFVEDESLSVSSIMKRLSAFGMGGWWLGGTHMLPNQSFLGEVQAKVPKSSKVIVGCQKGLRSLAACEQLSMAGYDAVAWVNGGFDTCKAGDLPTVNNVDLRYAGIGGLSELVGWTEVQQEQNRGLGSADGVIKLVAVVLALDLALFAFEYVNAVLLK